MQFVSEEYSFLTQNTISPCRVQSSSQKTVSHPQNTVSQSWNKLSSPQNILSLPAEYSVPCRDTLYYIDYTMSHLRNTVIDFSAEYSVSLQHTVSPRRIKCLPQNTVSQKTMSVPQNTVSVCGIPFLLNTLQCFP